MQCYILPADQQHPSNQTFSHPRSSAAAYQFNGNSNSQNYSHGQTLDISNYRNHPNKNLSGSHDNARGIFIRRKPNHSRPAQHGSYSRSMADYYSKTEIKVEEKYSAESNSVDYKYKIKNKWEEDSDTGSSSDSDID